MGTGGPASAGLAPAGLAPAERTSAERTSAMTARNGEPSAARPPHAGTWAGRGPRGRRTGTRRGRAAGRPRPPAPPSPRGSLPRACLVPLGRAVPGPAGPSAVRADRARADGTPAGLAAAPRQPRRATAALVTEEEPGA